MRAWPRIFAETMENRSNLSTGIADTAEDYLATICNGPAWEESQQGGKQKKGRGTDSMWRHLNICIQLVLKLNLFLDFSLL